MRKKLPILLLAIVFLLQVFIPAVYAASRNEAVASSASFCPFDTTSEGAGKAVKNGEFSISNWDNYPTNTPKPEGPFKMIEGSEYDAARNAANQANRAMHTADPSLNGMQIHEIQPVKFGGSPTDITNKIPLSPLEHAKATTWWRQLQREMQK